MLLGPISHFGRCRLKEEGERKGMEKEEEDKILG